MANREIVVKIRLSTAEWEQIKRAAGFTSMSAFMRSQALGLESAQSDILYPLIDARVSIGRLMEGPALSEALFHELSTIHRKLGDLFRLIERKRGARC